MTTTTKRPAYLRRFLEYNKYYEKPCTADLLWKFILSKQCNLYGKEKIDGLDPKTQKLFNLDQCSTGGLWHALSLFCKTQTGYTKTTPFTGDKVCEICYMYFMVSCCIFCFLFFFL